MLEVIGAGFGRTGTLTLKYALERLGFGPCHHMSVLSDDPEQVVLWTKVLNEGLDDWDTVYGDYRSTADWPGARYWRQIAGHFPDAKVILTVRDADSWYESCEGTIHQAMPDYEPGEAEWPDDLTLAEKEWLVNCRVWGEEFGGRFGDREYATRVYTEHNEAVRREVAPDRLLEYEVRQGWEPLCDFLDVPVPDEPFPRSHDREAFAEAVDREVGE